MTAAYETPMTSAEPVATTVTARATAPGSLVVLGTITILISSWAGIVPFVGPIFGYSADGTASWTWDLAHAVLGLLPGAVGVLSGFIMVSAGSRLALGIGRPTIAGAGVVAAMAGSWLAVGPAAWPVLWGRLPYFNASTPFRALVDSLGYSLGSGLILATCGGCAIGWAVRHRYASVPGRGGHGLRLHQAESMPAQD